jgi:GTP-binding protein
MSMTSGTGILTHIFDRFGPMKPGSIGSRINGVMISMVKGKALTYAMNTLQERGRLFIEPNTEVYEGMIVGLHSRENDIVVNPTKGKQLTNIRAAGNDENIFLTPPIRHSLEQAMEFIDSDELVEITPASIRLRKRFLLEADRKRASRGKE